MLLLAQTILQGLRYLGLRREEWIRVVSQGNVLKPVRQLVRKNKDPRQGGSREAQRWEGKQTLASCFKMHDGDNKLKITESGEVEHGVHCRAQRAAVNCQFPGGKDNWVENSAGARWESCAL